jgi:2-keto-4-pentenoate hydratase/2-oxohepta-3-ene-1,7-dioic acid hydratase in catechol pathway
MKLASVNYRGKEEAVVIYPEGAVPVLVIGEYIGSTWPGSLLRIIKEGRLDEIKRWFEADQGKAVNDLQKEIIPFADVRYSPLYRRPPKIIGVGLNYPEHIVNLKEKEPETYPGTFIKPATSIIGYGDKIMIPGISKRTTAEAELGIVIGKKAKNVAKKDWLKVVAGFTSIIDVTAEDILSLNPRFLTLAKGFDSFSALGHSCSLLMKFFHLKASEYRR